ncbi:hypothetical protein [Pelagibacterium xiamenense]|uniref:hypothetical protein n=1 Tax=Pelagibacterium xiamenense TaxID=2901140 RepID=UPI001E49DDE3|nr:hypothetical protein [Pelagibacterium xiamenense]MCD7059067.1 hypothetical protein [Pelagibacterium xiamenense]
MYASPFTLHRRLKRFALSVFVAIVALPVAGLAQSLDRTVQGHVSVATVANMISDAANDSAARDRLSLYLTGIGESAGYLVSMAGDAGMDLECPHSFSLGSDTAWAAIAAAAPDSGTWAQTPAAPIILSDMLERAGCR